MNDVELIRHSSKLRIKSRTFDNNVLMQKLSIFAMALSLLTVFLTDSISLYPPHPAIVLTGCFGIMTKFFKDKNKKIEMDVESSYSTLISETENPFLTDYIEKYLDLTSLRIRRTRRKLNKLFYINKIMDNRGDLNKIERTMYGIAVKYIENEKAR